MVGLKGHALIVNFAGLAEAKDLKAAAVGEDGAVPLHKVMQPTQIAHQFVAGAQIEVVGVAENKGCAQCNQFIGAHRFDSALGANGGEYGGLEDAVGGG